MSSKEIREFTIHHYEGDVEMRKSDFIAVEEPLSILVSHRDSIDQISITMRSPGNDVNLAVGFLYAEKVIGGVSEIVDIRSQSNEVTVVIDDDVEKDISLERNFYSSSSCGVCGKDSIDSVLSKLPSTKITPPRYDIEVIRTLSSKLRKDQTNFNISGGLHASALFTLEGELISIMEDVGRHNALDKLIGEQILKNQMPLGKNLLLLSGRVSFELVQKSAMAGIPIIVAIGAPSSLAIETARKTGQTLFGFVRGEVYNRYS